MYQTIIQSPLGPLLAKSDGEALISLSFDPPTFIKTNHDNILHLIQEELEAYFEGKLHHFSVPLKMKGTYFQNKVWNELRLIPYGKTLSYKELAGKVENPKGHRAVANANGANPFPLLIPCHRVIYADGSLGGYSCGIEKKRWLLEHEKENHNSF